MNSFWLWFLDWWPTIASAASGFVAALATFLVYRLRLRTEKAKNAALNEELRNAMRRLTYTVCPHCKSEVKLEELKWFLPGGFEDQNLNGVPDSQE